MDVVAKRQVILEEFPPLLSSLPPSKKGGNTIGRYKRRKNSNLLKEI
jgi:hypothetical protein